VGIVLGQHEFTPEELLTIAGIDAESENITAADLTTVAVALVQQLAARAHANEAGVGNGQAGSPAAWGYGFLAVTIVCAASALGVFFVRILNRPMVMVALIALGAGVLIGDAVLHLIPFTFGVHVHGIADTSFFGTTTSQLPWWWAVGALSLTTAVGVGVAEDERHTLKVGATIFAGVYLLFLVERGMNLFLDHDHGHNHSHGHNHDLPSYGTMAPGAVAAGRNESDAKLGLTTATDVEAEAGHPLTPTTDKPKVGGVRSLGWMIIVGDGFHNFVDGLAIGAAFNISSALGWSTFIAVLLHELPHEIGTCDLQRPGMAVPTPRLTVGAGPDVCAVADFAILIDSGFTWRRALMWNVLSALTAYIGFFIGVGAGGSLAAEVWILAFTAGMFLYIALTDLVRVILGK
jgi:zinc transporter ZupT